MKPPLQMCRAAFAFLVSAAFPLSAADLDQNLVARWTFKDGSLESDVGHFAFSESGGGTMQAGKGTVTLGGDKLLIADGISSVALPELKKAVTIWARMKFDVLPPEYEVNVMGLQREAGAGDWSAMALSLLYRAVSADNTRAGLAFLGRGGDGSMELGVGSSRFVPVTAGEYVNVALVFDAGEGAASMWVNGQLESSRNPDVRELSDFMAFGIGRLKSPGADCTVTFDEVRIYSTVLGPEWLAEIQPAQD